MNWPDSRISDKIADGVFLLVGRVMASVAKFSRRSHARTFTSWIRYDGLENFTAAQAKGRGVLVATAHLGNWELSAFAHA